MSICSIISHNYNFLREYKVRYKSSAEGSKAEELIFPTPAVCPTTCSVQLEVSCTTFATAIIIPSQGLTPGIQYKVNITAIVEDKTHAKIESKALHGKVKHLP
jgi:hypothetical protein